MGDDDESETDMPAASREAGVEFGELKEKLASHEYPTTGDELVEEYGDFELELPGGSETFGEILGKRRSTDGDDDDLQYESPDEVHQMVLTMVGSDAVGREGYSDRGGSPNQELREEDRDKETM